MAVPMAVPLCAALPLSTQNSFGTSPTAEISTPAKPIETIFFAVNAGQRSVLGRCNADGTCKAYLGSSGQGWLPYADRNQIGNDLMAASAPDGTRFALLSSRGGSVNLWLVSADGRHFEALTQDEAGIMKASQATQESFSFSPDGKNLAYIDRNNLWVVSLAGRQARTLTFDGDIEALAWAPTSDALAVVQNNDVRRVALNGSSNRILVLGGCIQPDVAWSKNPQNPTDLYYMGHGAARVDDAMNTTLLAPSSVENNSMAVLASGIALLAPASSGGQAEVYLAPNGAASKPTQITQGGATAVFASSDGQTLYFLRDQILWRCELDGTHARPLAAAPMGRINIGALIPLPGACQ